MFIKSVWHCVISVCYSKCVTHSVFFLPDRLPLAPNPNSPSSSGTWPGLLVRAKIPQGGNGKKLVMNDWQNNVCLPVKDRGLKQKSACSDPLSISPTFYARLFREIDHRKFWILMNCSWLLENNWNVFFHYFAQ